MHWTPFAAAAAALVSSVTALDPIETYGNKFFKKDGSQFFLKGVAYQRTDKDPLLDASQCQKDASLMKELGANSIRVYHVDADGDHDGCMSAFSDAGIYALIDLDTFDTYILPHDLFWNQTQQERYAKVMDTFHGYDNTLGFFIGNENIAQKADSVAGPYLKAAARDMKAYRDSKGYREIPIGYSAADIKELRPMLQDYLTCGGNSSDIIDFFGLNSYSWCGASGFTESTYDQLEEQAKNFPVPIFLTETGCIVPSPRLWDDQDAIFGKEMANDWSGAIAYEWIQEANEYGLIEYDGPKGPDGFARSGTPKPRQPDFQNLKQKWANNNPTGTKKADYNTKLASTRACPSATPGGWWEVSGNVAIPTLGETYSGGYHTVASATSDPSDHSKAGEQAQSSSQAGSRYDSQSSSSAKPSETQSSDQGQHSAQTQSGNQAGASTNDSSAKNSASPDDDSGAMSDKHLTIAGTTFISLTLGVALLL